MALKQGVICVWNCGILGVEGCWAARSTCEGGRQVLPPWRCRLECSTGPKLCSEWWKNCVCDVPSAYLSVEASPPVLHKFREPHLKGAGYNAALEKKLCANALAWVWV
eukprot:1160317-Pelagomonas_calceolata.AAC.20